MAAKPTGRQSWITRERAALAGLLLFALVVRGGVLFAMREKLRDDPDAYRRIAENLLSDGVFSMDYGERLGIEIDGGIPMPKTPTAYRPPLYPVVLSNLGTSDGAHVSLFKVATLHLLLGVGTVWLTWATARRLQIGNCKLQIANCDEDVKSWWAEPTLRMPLVAGVIVACDPILLNQSALVMTETLATFLAILSLWCLARFDSQRSWFNSGLAGGAMGLAVLCRPTFLPWLVLVGAGMLVVRGRIASCKMQTAKGKLGWGDVGWRALNCAALVGVAAIVVSPWVIRNQRVFGKPIVTTTHGGYTLLLGNNSDFYEYLRSAERTSAPWTPRMNGEQGYDSAFDAEFTPEFDNEPYRDQAHYVYAWDRIQGDKAGFALASLYRIRQLWSPLPNRLTAEEAMGRRMLRYAVAGWYCGVYVLAAVGVWRIWKSGPPLRGRPAGRGNAAAGGTAGGGESAGGAVLPRSGGPHWGGRPRWVWGVLLCVVFTGVHTFYWSNLRMRAPLMPFVACVAAAAFVVRQKQPRMDAEERG